MGFHTRAQVACQPRCNLAGDAGANHPGAVAVPGRQVHAMAPLILVLLRVERPHPPSQSTLAWRAGENGRGLRWWVERLSRPELAETLFY